MNSYSSKVEQWTETMHSKLNTFPNKLGLPWVIEQTGHSGNWFNNYLSVVVIDVIHTVGESYGKGIMRKWHTANHCDKSCKHRRLSASQICEIPNHSQNPVSHMLFKESHKLTPVSVLLRSDISKFFKIRWKIGKGGWALSVMEDALWGLGTSLVAQL